MSSPTLLSFLLFTVVFFKKNICYFIILVRNSSRGVLIFFFFTRGATFILLGKEERLCLIPGLEMGTIIPFGKSPYNPWAITRCILQLSNSRFETFEVLSVLLARILKGVRSQVDEHFRTKSSALAAASNSQEGKASRHNRGFMSETAIGVSGGERRDVCACPSCYMVIHTLAQKARSVLDLLADLWLALQCCRLFGEQHSSFLCCYFKAGFLLPSITEAVCKLRSFQGLSLDVRARRDPYIQGKICALLWRGGGQVKIKST